MAIPASSSIPTASSVPAAISRAGPPRSPRHSPAAPRATAIISTNADAPLGGFGSQRAPRDFVEWGALAALSARPAAPIGRCRSSRGWKPIPGSDALKHFGAALASLRLGGAVLTCPASPPRKRCLAASAATPSSIGRAEIAAFLARFAAPGDKLDVVVFAAPQLSLYRDRGGSGRPRRAPGASRHDGDRRDLARDQACRRPHGPDRPHRDFGRRRRCKASASTRAMRARWPRPRAGRG